MVAFRITSANQLETMTCLPWGKVKISFTYFLKKEKLDKMDYALTSGWYINQRLSDFWAVSAPVTNYNKRFLGLKRGCSVPQVSQDGIWWEISLPMAGCWNSMSSKHPSNPTEKLFVCAVSFGGKGFWNGVLLNVTVWITCFVSFSPPVTLIQF